MQITVQEACQSQEGSGKYEFTLLLTNGEQTEQRSMLIFRFFLQRMLGDTPIPTAGEAIDCTLYETLLAAEEATRAAWKAVNLLAFGDKTCGQLERKLRQKGFCGEAAAAAVQFCQQRGYIREEEHLLRLMQILCDQKLYGPIRIQKEVRARCFSEDVVRAVFAAAAEELDFDAALDKRISKMKADAFSGRENTRKTYAALMRYGFRADQIRAAQKRFGISDTDDADDIDDAMLSDMTDD